MLSWACCEQARNHLYEVLQAMATSIQDKPRYHPNLKLNDSMITAICDIVSKGNYYVTACNICGVTPQTFYNWMQQAEKDETDGKTEENSLFLKFLYSVKRAEAIAESKLVDVVRESAEVKREWLPAMTFLERRHPDRWGRKDRNTVTIDEHKTITITHVEVIKPADYVGQIVEGEARELTEGEANVT